MKKVFLMGLVFIGSGTICSTEWQFDPEEVIRAEVSSPSLCESDGEMTPACIEQLINDFNGADWFVEQSLPMIPDTDRAFIKAYLNERRLELWGELGTPTMVKRRLFWAPLNALVTNAAALLGLAAGSFTLGTIVARDCDKSYSVGRGYVNDSVVAAGFLGVSALGAFLNIVLNAEVKLYQKKLGKLEAVEALVNLLD